MSDSDSDYNVESYIKPTVKRSTYNNDDTYLSDEVKNSDSEKSNDSEDEIIEDIKEQMDDSTCVVEKEAPIVKIKQKKVEEEPVRTNNRFILYVSNLTSETTKTMIEAFFSDAGHIKSVRIPKKRLSNFAFVEMKDLEGLKNGLKYDARELDGRKIKVQQGSKNKKHISNRCKMLKKKKLQIFEKKHQNRIKNP